MNATTTPLVVVTVYGSRDPSPYESDPTSNETNEVVNDRCITTQPGTAPRDRARHLPSVNINPDHNQGGESRVKYELISMATHRDGGTPEGKRLGWSTRRVTIGK